MSVYIHKSFFQIERVDRRPNLSVSPVSHGKSYLMSVPVSD